MDSLNYQARRLVSYVSTEQDGTSIAWISAEPSTNLDDVLIQQGRAKVGVIHSILNLLGENDPSKYADALFFPSLFYEIKVLVQGDFAVQNTIRSHLGFEAGDDVLLELPVSMVWQVPVLRRLAVSMELWLFVEATGMYSEVYIDRWRVIKDVILDCVHNEPTADAINLWFASLCKRYTISFEVSERCSQLSSLILNYKCGDLQLQEAILTPKQAQPMMACVVSELPELPVLRGVIDEQTFRLERVLCQLGVMMEEVSLAELDAGVPMCWLVRTSDPAQSLMLVGAKYVSQDLEFASLVSRYRKWHKANLICSPSKSFEVFIDMRRTKLAGDFR